MISICIPVYNHDVTRLVGALKKQAEHVRVVQEIIIADDASDEAYRQINRNIGGAMIEWIWLEENIGRASVRNRLAASASGEFILFLDCDSEIGHNDFLLRYCEVLKREVDVVCGGRIYTETNDVVKKRLHYRYGRKTESRTVGERSRKPFHSFMTNNFMIRRSVLLSIPFDETIKTYGHEDTLMGYQLMLAKASMLHIDNPVIHGKIETDEEFLNKTKLAVENLARIRCYHQNEPQLVEMVTLLKVHNKIKRLLPVAVAELLCRSALSMLKKGIAGLTILGVYKLMLLHIILKKFRSAA